MENKKKSLENLAKEKVDGEKIKGGTGSIFNPEPNGYTADGHMEPGYEHPEEIIHDPEHDPQHDPNNPLPHDPNGPAPDGIGDQLI